MPAPWVIRPPTLHHKSGGCEQYKATLLACEGSHHPAKRHSLPSLLWTVISGTLLCAYQRYCGTHEMEPSTKHRLCLRKHATIAKSKTEQQSDLVWPDCWGGGAWSVLSSLLPLSPPRPRPILLPCSTCFQFSLKKLQCSLLHEQMLCGFNRGPCWSKSQARWVGMGRAARWRWDGGHAVRGLKPRSWGWLPRQLHTTAGLRLWYDPG